MKTRKALLATACLMCCGGAAATPDDDDKLTTFNPVEHAVIGDARVRGSRLSLSRNDLAVIVFEKTE